MIPPVVAVTGANRGLGLALATTLSRDGAEVILLCRDPSRGEAARALVAAAATGPAPRLVLVSLDDLGSVRRAAGELLAAHDRFHALVHNAAVFTRERRLTPDGHELMFATNHLGPFLLTNLLLPALGGARVLTVSAPSTVEIDFDDLGYEKEFKPLRAFGASKMANLLCSFELARRSETLGITANALHPGLVRSDLMREAPAPLRWATRLGSRPPVRSAAAIVPVILGEEHAATNGQLLKGGRPVATNEYARDPANQARLWEVSRSLTGLPPES